MSVFDKEKDSIVDGLKQIDEFCQNEIAPEIDNRHSISIKFGEDSKYELLVTDRYSMLGVGNSYYGFTEGEEKNIYDRWYLARELLVNWQDIKTQLISRVEQFQEEHLAIMDFHI